MSPSVIVTRVVLLLLVLAGGLKLLSMWNQKRQVERLFDEMRVLASESSYFRQFDADEASRTLVRLTGMLWRAELAGVPPEQALDRLFQTGRGLFGGDRKEPEAPRQRLIRESLAHNRDALRKLGYPAVMATLDALEDGYLPTLREGPFSGQRPVVHRIVDPALLPGLDTNLANFEIRPPGKEEELDDVRIARIRQLVRQLGYADILDQDAIERLMASLEKLREPPPEK